ncbi:MAG: hypothetical protein FJ098_10070, partial [Deltaproteobacteria bacterium]|nr:hypothetical protein [Deltaproteobacteria bacterium]
RLWTPCAQTSDAGLCTGKRVCTAEGLSACDAAIPVPEVCNGLDEDCDGEVDEPALQEGVYVPVCDDGKPCTQDACLGQAGCDHVSLTGGECTDGDACTAGDHCVQGTCTGQAVTCDDGNPCTDDSCDGLGGCLAAPNAADCDDGDPCTAGDHCAAGICAGEAVDCQCQDDDDCAVLEDGDVCNGTLVCATDLVPHLCILEPGSQVSCPEPPAGPDALCLSATCDPLTGTCGFVPANEGKACEDGNACTFGDLCGDGNCEAGPLLACADGNPCTDDSCLPASGCSFLPNAAPCTDQNPCTNGDHCAGGACAHTSVTACNDGNPCTTDSCNPSTGGCLFIVNQEPCNDGNTCTTGDHCHLGDCIAGGTLPCSDGNVCTDDACHPATGCTFTPNAAPCTDLNPCSLGDHCQNGWCLPTSFENCNDLNVCTNDTCTATGACLHTPNAATCNDGDACTVTDQCAGGECLGTGSLACSDGNVCTDDACLPAVGCTFTVNSAPCDDGNACTPSSQCVQGACLGSGTASCSDGNPCTSDTCDPQAGCQSVPAAGPCSDGNACTVGDQCAGGLCQGTGSLSCNDGKPCTADACDPLLGCVAPLVPNCCGNGLVEAGESCDDGNLAAGDGCDGQCALESSGCVKLGVDVRTLEQPPSDWQLGYCNSAYCEDTPTVIPAGWHIATIAEVAHLATYVKFGSCAAYGICGSYWYGGGVLTSGCSMLHYTCPTGGCTAYTSHCYTQVLLIRDGKDGTCHTGP